MYVYTYLGMHVRMYARINAWFIEGRACMYAHIYTHASIAPTHAPTSQKDTKSFFQPFWRDFLDVMSVDYDGHSDWVEESASFAVSMCKQKKPKK